MTNSTDSSKPSGRSIRREWPTDKWVGYCWERVTCLQVIDYAVTEDMTEAEARAWLAA